MITTAAIRQTVGDLLGTAERFLIQCMMFPSTSGNEHDLLQFLNGAFASLRCAVEPVPMSNQLRLDPDYSNPIPDLNYDGRFNLRVRRRGQGGGKTLLLNAHTDVVPPSEGMPDPWSPRAANGIVFGRGACDDKGPLASVVPGAGGAGRARRRVTRRRRGAFGVRGGERWQRQPGHGAARGRGRWVYCPRTDRRASLQLDPRCRLVPSSSCAARPGTVANRAAPAAPC